MLKQYLFHLLFRTLVYLELTFPVVTISRSGV